MAFPPRPPCRGPPLQVPPLEFFNLESLFSKVVIYLTYSTHYSSTGRSSQDSPPAPASLEKPGDAESWLYSPAGLLNSVRAVLCCGGGADWAGGWLAGMEPAGWKKRAVMLLRSAPPCTCGSASWRSTHGTQTQ